MCVLDGGSQVSGKWGRGLSFPSWNLSPAQQLAVGHSWAEVFQREAKRQSRDDRGSDGFQASQMELPWRNRRNPSAPKSLSDCSPDVLGRGVV